MVDNINVNDYLEIHILNVRSYQNNLKHFVNLLFYVCNLINNYMPCGCVQRQVIS